MANGTAFSYESDIAPLQRSYFGDVPVPPAYTPSQPTGNFGRFGNVRRSGSSTTLEVGGGDFGQMVSSMRDRAEFDYRRQIERENLEYQTALINQQRYLMDLQIERDASVLGPEVIKKVESVFETKKSAAEQAQEIAKIQFENPSILKSNFGKLIFQTANDRVQANSNAELSAREGKSVVVNSLTPINAEAANAVASGTLSIEEGRKLIQGAQTAETERKIKAAEAEEKKDIQKFDLKLQLDVLDGIESAWKATTSKTGGALAAIPENATLDSLRVSGISDPNNVLDDFQRSELKTYMSDLTGKPLENVEKEYANKDLQLYRDLGKAVRQKRRDILGSSYRSAFPTEKERSIGAGFKSSSTSTTTK
jgi:hypothetical protein